MNRQAFFDQHNMPDSSHEIHKTKSRFSAGSKGTRNDQNLQSMSSSAYGVDSNTFTANNRNN
jgi:hypothetical protein